MTTRLGLGLSLLGALALAACGGGDGSISGVVPGDVFAGRSANEGIAIGPAILPGRGGSRAEE